MSLQLGKICALYAGEINNNITVFARMLARGGMKK